MMIFLNFFLCLYFLQLLFFAQLLFQFRWYQLFNDMRLYVLLVRGLFQRPKRFKSIDLFRSL